jgi:hypothetical protein
MLRTISDQAIQLCKLLADEWRNRSIPGLEGVSIEPEQGLLQATEIKNRDRSHRKVSAIPAVPIGIAFATTEYGERWSIVTARDGKLNSLITAEPYHQWPTPLSVEFVDLRTIEPGPNLLNCFERMLGTDKLDRGFQDACHSPIRVTATTYLNLTRPNFVIDGIDSELNAPTLELAHSLLDEAIRFWVSTHRNEIVFVVSERLSGDELHKSTSYLKALERFDELAEHWLMGRTWLVARY